MHIVNPSGVKFSNKYLNWFRCLGLEDHGFGGGTNGGKKAASNAKRHPLCENKRIPFTRNPPVSCLLGRCPNPRRTQKLCSGTMDKSIGCAIFQIAYGGQLNAAPPLFSVVHLLPPAPCPVPEYGRCWLWPSAVLSFSHGLFGTRHILFLSLL